MDLGGIGTRSIELDEDRRHELESEWQGESGARRESEKIGRRPAGEVKNRRQRSWIWDLGEESRVCHCTVCLAKICA